MLKHLREKKATKNKQTNKNQTNKQKKKQKKTHTNQLCIGFMNPCIHKPTQEICIYIMG